METEPGKFKLSARKSYREVVSAQVYPTDIVHLHFKGVYELRTPKRDFHIRSMRNDSYTGISIIFPFIAKFFNSFKPTQELWVPKEYYFSFLCTTRYLQRKNMAGINA